MFCGHSIHFYVNANIQQIQDEINNGPKEKINFNRLIEVAKRFFTNFTFACKSSLPKSKSLFDIAMASSPYNA